MVERDSWYAYAEYQTAICPDCNQLRVFCSTPDGLYGEGFYPQLNRCFITAAQEATKRRYDRHHKNDEPDEYDALSTDGTKVWMALDNLTPDDDFLNENPGEPDRVGGPPNPLYEPEP